MQLLAAVKTNNKQKQNQKSTGQGWHVCTCLNALPITLRTQERPLSFPFPSLPRSGSALAEPQRGTAGPELRPEAFIHLFPSIHVMNAERSSIG